MSFRLITLLYLFALTAASLAVFGAWGLVVAAIVHASWVAIVIYRRWWTTDRTFWVLVILLVLAGFYPAVVNSHPRNRHSMSRRHAMQLTLSLNVYHDVNGSLPPPFVTDDQGHPLYSWRVLMLPYIEGDHIYRKLHLDEPWDSPHNRPLIDRVDASIFASPRIRNPFNNFVNSDYVAIIDDRTIWCEGKKISYANISDGTANTIALMEVGGLGIHWAEPRDITVDQAVDLLTGQAPNREEVFHEGYFVTEVYRLHTRIVGFLDGHACGYGPLKHKSDALALLTRSGREVLPQRLKELDAPPTSHVQTIIHWTRIWGVAVWLGLVLAPAIPAIRRRILPTPLAESQA